SKDLIENYYQLNRENPNKYPITDWTNLMIKSSAPRQTHILNLSGGNENARSSASFIYDQIDALYNHRTYERITARINNDFKFNKYLAAYVDVNFKRTIDKQPSMDPMYNIRIAAPIYAATWTDGRIADGKTGNNIYGQIEQGGYNHSWYNQLNGRIGLDITPITGLKISGIFSPTFNFTKQKNWHTAVPWYTADDPTVLGGYLQWSSTTSLNEVRNDNYRWTSQFLVNYNKTFGAHSLDLLGGFESFYAFNEDLGASRGLYTLTQYPYLNIGPEDLRDNSGNAYENAYQSWFGRVMYNYNNKYLLQANIRYDGSSRFAAGYRWGAFPSISLGWVISEEEFLKKQDFLSFLKLRASWGSLGNERIGNYPYQGTIQFATSLFYQGTNIIPSQAAAQWRYAIENITWETTETYDVGIDANILNNRLRFSADYYKKMTRDMLLALQIPTYLGFDNPDQNTGKMHTSGWDLEIGWHDKIGDVRYNISANISDYKSIMGDLGGTEFLGDQVKKKDSEFNEWYGYKAKGIYQTQEQVDHSAKTSGSIKVGDIEYEDINGPDGIPDGKISPEYDRVLLGGSLPRYAYGLNLGLNYQNLDFGMVFQGIGKQNVRLGTMMIQPLLENWGGVPSILDGNYFGKYNTEEQNLTAKYPRLTESNKGNNYAMSDFWLFNGAYLRLKNISLGYTFPKSLVQKLTLQNLRVYASVSDVFSINNYPKGWDPENGGSSYPITTSCIFGISVKF
ncbi:MAG: SusC/RagA family TonB-linked outer membrane protein, partial [Dysgonamonadaceae bacterium]|nr:SusC/RagA family TonB-linked outer membrane protein [Dysgonamonadaceae bacterium]